MICDTKVLDLLEAEIIGGAVIAQDGFLAVRVKVRADAGGYAHLISAAAQWALYLEGKRDWELQNIPEVAPRK